MPNHPTYFRRYDGRGVTVKLVDRRPDSDFGELVSVEWGGNVYDCVADEFDADFYEVEPHPEMPL